MPKAQKNAVPQKQQEGVVNALRLGGFGSRVGEFSIAESALRRAKSIWWPEGEI